MARLQIANLLFTFVALSAFLAPVSSSFIASPEAMKYSFLSVVCLGSLSLLMFKPDVKGGFAFMKSWLSCLLFVFVAWAYLSGIWALDSQLTLGRATEWLICLLVYFISLHTIVNEESLEKLFVFLFLAAIAVAFIGILQHFFNFDLFLQAAPPAATFGNRNMAIHFMVLTFSLGMWLFLKEKKVALIYFYAFGLVLICAYVVVTGTRAGWLAIAFELLFLLVFFFVLRSRGTNLFSKAKVAPLFGAITLIVLITNIQSPKKETPRSVLARAYSITQERNVRFDIWQNSLPMIKDNFVLGVGLGNWHIHYPKYQGRVVADRLFNEQAQAVRLHNDYLTTVIELGLVGLLLYLGVLGLVIHRVSVLIKRLRANYLIFFFAVTGALIGFSVNAFFSFPFEVFYPLLLVFLFMAVIENLYFQTKRDANDLEVFNSKNVKAMNEAGSFLLLPKKPAQLLSIFLALGAVLLLFRNFNNLKGEHKYLQATTAELKKDWPKVIAMATKANELRPNHARTLGYLGQAYSNQGQHKQARAYFEQALRRNPNHVNLLFFYARAEVRAGKFKRAGELYKQVLDLYAGWAKAHKNYGILLQNYLFEPIQAIKHFKLALKYDPEIDQADQLRSLIQRADSGQ